MLSVVHIAQGNVYMCEQELAVYNLI